MRDAESEYDEALAAFEELRNPYWDAMARLRAATDQLRATLKDQIAEALAREALDTKGDDA